MNGYDMHLYQLKEYEIILSAAQFHLINLFGNNATQIINISLTMLSTNFALTRYLIGFVNKLDFKLRCKSNGIFLR